ncbi:GPP34 family phosphoprotein [Streptomyces sp. NPDC056121]|uniref:GOLPH3/VPS74 family protein n=1 Tax=Streptomyces TaxID=1883 RepID=UPI001D0AD147|nr:GPP34 family phosphoprotein [Streptomyces longhuiensis]UDM03159.1 GPP34 family phosphoprotein [Streptomyces longhuiensis]
MSPRAPAPTLQEEALVPHDSLSLPARLCLLGFDTEKGKVSGAPDLALCVRAAALVELARRRIISDVDGVVTPVFDARTGDPVLDELMELAEESRPRSWRTWIGYRSGAGLDTVRRQLASEGYLSAERKRAFGLFPVTRYGLARAGYVEVLRAEVLGALEGAEPADRVDEDDAVLAVLAATGKLRRLIAGKARRTHKDRLDELAARAGAVSPELGRSLGDIRAALAAAVKAAEAARASAGGG